MPFSKENRIHTLNGILFVGLFAVAAFYIAAFPLFQHLGISPLIIGIVIGAFYGNTLRHRLPEEWTPGIIFSTKTLLRIAIIFYGFRVTFQNIEAVGLEGVAMSVIMVTTTFLIGTIAGMKLFGLDRDTAMLTASGSAVCGAAAVLATEPVLKAEPYKSAIAVATVILFGTTSMFLYPFLYRMGFLHMDLQTMGLYVGGTVHEVAHVVGAGNAINAGVTKYAVIVKMIRVMMIVPLLIGVSIYIALRPAEKSGEKEQGENEEENPVAFSEQEKIPAPEKARDERFWNKISIPWFAVLFIAVAGFNSFNLLPHEMLETINNLDTFALTMAMTALGIETNLSKFKGVGLKPFWLALIMFLWLLGGGYFITQLLTGHAG